MENKQLKRIVIIGPAYPYKGGISHYTSLLYKNIIKHYEAELVSFSYLYPKLLYKKPQKDYENDLLKIDGVHFWINTVNPFNWINSARKIKALKPDLIIIHWWHPYFMPCYASMLGMIKKIPKLILCSNVLPHGRFKGDSALTKAVLKKGSAFIVHSDKDVRDLEDIIPGAIHKQMLLPSFSAFKQDDMTRAEARKRLGIPEGDRVALFFGFVQEYKGLDDLIAAIPKAAAGVENFKLLIVGEFGEFADKYAELIKNSGVSECIQVYNEYVPDKDIQMYFSACDVVVLPYKSATSSGIVQMAYVFDRPVIATDVGGLPDVVIDEKTGYIVKHNDPASVAEGIIRFFAENRAEEFKAGIKEQAYRFSWDRAVDTIRGVWDEIQSKAGREK